MSNHRNPAVTAALAGLLAIMLSACHDVLTVSDPQRYTSGDLDKSLDAVANGVEGDLYTNISALVNYTALNSDEYQHTGTWIGYDNYDSGRFYFSYASGGGGGDGSDGIMDGLLRDRFFAQAAQERFTRVMGDTASSSALMAQVKTVQGWDDLLIGQNYCEAPAEDGGPTVPQADILAQAVAELTDAAQTAQSAGASDFHDRAVAGRARAHLLLGNYADALQDARSVPDGFIWSASFSENSGRQYNSLVQLTTSGFLAAAAVREYYWDRVDVAARKMRDPYSGQLDARLPVYYNGEIAADGLTPDYSQWKYQTLGSDIPMTDAKEMRLIEAEVLWHQSDLAGALAMINKIRAGAGLDPHPSTTDAQQVFDYLLYERFAELWLEGQRMSDLHRFGLVEKMVADGIYGSQSADPRPTEFPLSYAEASNNTNISRAISDHCLPMSR